MMRKIFYIAALFLACVSCEKAEFIDEPYSANEQPIIQSTTATRSALVDNGDGYFRAKECVPLVGVGRMVDNLNSSLVSAVNLSDGESKVTDLNLTNCAKYSGVVGADLLEGAIVSVKDVNRVYAGGQQAGFAISVSNSSLLTAKVLKTFKIVTYRNDEKQEEFVTSTGSETLGLKLITFASGSDIVKLSQKVNRPFDEIELRVNGIDASALSALNVYYAFVGENKEIPLVTGGEYDGVTVDASMLVAHKDNVINNNLNDGCDIMPKVAWGSVTGMRVKVAISNSTIPAGYEVGFCMDQVTLACLDLVGGGLTLTAGKNNSYKEEVLLGNSLLGVSALGASRSNVSMVAASDFNYIQIYNETTGLNLSEQILHYAYVKKPVAVDISSYFALSDATTYSNSYTFAKPQSGTLSVSAITGGITVDGNVVKGMDKEGVYTLSYTYTDEDSNSFSGEVNITKVIDKIETDCNKIIAHSELGMYDNAAAFAPSNKNNYSWGVLVDNLDYNYVDYRDYLSLLSETPIVEVDAHEYINTGNKSTRVGFTVEYNSDFLSLDAIKLFKVKLYKDGSDVQTSLIDKNNAVGLDLISSSSSQVRISVTTTETFDAVALYADKILGLDLENIKVYNAFYEDAETCNSISTTEACMDIISSNSHNAQINYDETKTSEGLLSVNSGIKNISNIIDDNKDSYAEATTTVGALEQMTIAVKFNELPAGSPVGFIIESQTDLLAANVLNGVEISIYKDGYDVANNSDFGVLNAQVIGDGGLMTVEKTSALPFNEARITFKGVVGASNFIKVYGLYTRVDSDGDGIPDCATGPSGSGVKADVGTPVVCLGDMIDINLYNLPDGTNSYWVKSSSDGSNAEQVAIQNGKLTFEATESGEYVTYAIYNSGPTGDASVESVYSGLMVEVHPSKTTWKSNAASTDWNDWNNWSDGTPWSCTDVILPNGCSNYPVLKSNEGNYCHHIYFEPKTELGNPQYLTYSGHAWAELELEPNKYNLLSFPFKSMYTGDMFIPRVMDGTHSMSYFTELTATNYIENRLNPRIFQRLWNQQATGYTLDGSSISFNSEGWTKPFNDVAQEYTLGLGLSVWVDNMTLDNSKFKFCFPKSHTVYKYFTDAPSGTNVSGDVKREDIGRFITENNGKTTLPMTIELKNANSSNTFIFGNPFMTHISVLELKKDNNAISKVLTYNGDGSGTEEVSDDYKIAPFEAVFVEFKTANTSTSVKVTESMLTTKF